MRDDTIFQSQNINRGIIMPPELEAAIKRAELQRMLNKKFEDSR